MNRIPLTIIIRTFLLFVPIFAHAQKYSYKESADEMKDWEHEIYYMPSKKIILINYAGPHGAFSYKRDENNSKALAYDLNMNQLYEKPIAALDGKKYKGGAMLGGRLYMFYTDKKNDFYVCPFNDADAGSGTPGSLSFNGDDEEPYTNIYKAFSPDSSRYFFSLGKYTPKTGMSDFIGVILDKQANIVSKVSFSVDRMEGDVATLDFLLSNDGILYMIRGFVVSGGGKRKKSSDDPYNPIRYDLAIVDKEGLDAHLQIAGLPQGNLGAVSWKPDSKGFSFIGFLSRSEKMGFTTIVSGRYDRDLKKAVDIKESEIANSTFFKTVGNDENMTDILKEGVKVFAKFDMAYELPDHSKIIVLEGKGSRTMEHGSSSHPFWRTDYWSTWAYVFKLDANNDLQWFRYIMKNSLETVHLIYTGLVALKDNKDGVHIFFHAFEKELIPKKIETVVFDGGNNKSQLYAVYIDKDGKINKQPVIDNDNVDQFLSTVNPVVTNDMVIYTAYRFKAAGRSTFRVGMINIK